MTETQNWYPYPLPDPPAMPSGFSSGLAVGTDVPSDVIGNNGDVYLRENNNIYQKRDGAWVSVL